MTDKAPNKGKKKLSPWILHAKKTYSDGKKKDKNYKYSQALKDAKKTYKK